MSGLSKELEEKLKEINTTVASLAQNLKDENKPKKSTGDPLWKQRCKLFGTLLILITWGYENYSIKPIESEKQTEMFNRSLAAVTHQQTKQADFAISVLQCFSYKDSSKAVRSMVDFNAIEDNRAINDEWLTTTELLKSRFANGWSGDQHNNFMATRDSLNTWLAALLNDSTSIGQRDTIIRGCCQYAPKNDYETTKR